MAEALEERNRSSSLRLHYDRDPSRASGTKTCRSAGFCNGKKVPLKRSCAILLVPKFLFSDVTCEPPPEIAGGKVQGVKKPRYLPGETAHYQCWQGFQMTGASTVTCQNGTWTGRPQCKGDFLSAFLKVS
uniref:Sushi domain-containing protein n=1 Tax=Anas zonorhyncha TaxID=75864 RepID=A0A8B9ZQR6_9AVES